MPVSITHANGAVLTRGLDPEPSFCRLRPALPQGFVLRTDGWISREFDDLQVCRAFEVRLRLASTRGTVALLRVSTFGAHEREAWCYEGMMLRAVEHRELTRHLRRYGLEVDRTPIATVLTRELLVYAIRQKGACKRLTRRGAEKLFSNLERPEIAPRQAILDMCGHARRASGGEVVR